MQPISEVNEKFIMSQLDDILFFMQKYRETKDDTDFNKADALLKATKFYLIVKEWYKS